MGYTTRAVVCFGLILLGLSGPAAAKRLALVIGNDIYKNLPAGQQLKKTRNDARAVAGALEGLGFTVTLGLDVARFGLNQKIDALAKQIEPGDTAAVFFAGHGVRIQGRNYLLPADVPDMSHGSQDLLAGESVAVDKITDRLKASGARIVMLILDACRDNPFKDTKGRSVGGTRGLARVEPPEGTIVLFSAGANQQALDRLSDDDQNPNSVFTRSLIPMLTQDGLEVGRMARLLRQKVRKLAASINYTQTPAVYNELTGDFYISPPGAVAKAPQPKAAPKPTPPSVDNTAIELAYWNAIQDSKHVKDIRSYLQRFPNGVFSELAKARIERLQKQAAIVRPKDEPKDIEGSAAASLQGRKLKINLTIGRHSGARRCPDPKAPGVSYTSQDPSVCARVEISCGSGKTYIPPNCGCGCLDAKNESKAPKPPASPGAGQEGLIGAHLSNFNHEWSKCWSLPKREGVLVAQLAANGAASAAGVRVGDVILSWDGTVPSTAEQLAAIVGRTSAGANVPIGIWRVVSGHDGHVAKLRSRAARGDSLAIVCLASMYQSGLYVDKDLKEAVNWWRKAAEKGDADAMLRVGDAYARGQGVAKDDAEAERWFRKADEQEKKVAVGVFPDKTKPKSTRSYKPGDEFQECDDCPNMVVVPAGSFTMGSPKGESKKHRGDDEGPQRQVRIARPFAVGKFEVTFAEWDACVSNGGCGHSPNDEGWGRALRPVIYVSWDDAKEYVKWLSRKTGKSYRLLSEAEWEYAARAGTKTPFSTGRTIRKDQANFDRNYPYDRSRKRRYPEKTVKVGSFSANQFGLHDMHGNVSEWVEDCYVDSYRGASTDGSAHTSGNCSRRGLRGGNWNNLPGNLRSAQRIGHPPDFRRVQFGFRVARTLTPLKKAQDQKVAVGFPPAKPRTSPAPRPADTIALDPRVIPVGKWPEGIAYDGKYLWVAESGNRRIAQIDPVRMRIVKRVSVGRLPVNMLALPDRRILSLVHTDKKLWQQDPRSGKGRTLARIGDCPWGLTGDSAALWVVTYVNCTGDRSIVFEIDPKRGTTRRRFDLPEGPSDITSNQAGVFVIHTFRQDSTLSAINKSSGEVRQQSLPGARFHYIRATNSRLFAAGAVGEAGIVASLIHQNPPKARLPQQVGALAVTDDFVVAVGISGTIYVLAASDLTRLREITTTRGAFRPQTALIVGDRLYITTHNGNGQNGSVLIVDGWRP